MAIDQYACPILCTHLWRWAMPGDLRYWIAVCERCGARDMTAANFSPPPSALAKKDISRRPSSRPVSKATALPPS